MLLKKQFVFAQLIRLKLENIFCFTQEAKYASTTIMDSLYCCGYKWNTNDWTAEYFDMHKFLIFESQLHNIVRLQFIPT
jgi:hypothetical protein